MSSQKISFENLAPLENRDRNPNYGAFFSSVFNGFTADTRLMLIPIDDHMVHRGDGVFEAIKIVNNKPYLFAEHMARMERSARAIGIPLYKSLEVMKETALKTWELSRPVFNSDKGLLRLFLSRGPGNFGVNPYDTVGSQFYVAVTKLSEPKPEQFANGVRIGKSKILAKASWMAQVKSCNYLPNVMQKKEAVDRKLDFVISLDETGAISESATENIVILDQHGTLLRPSGEYILEGCTMQRALQLAKPLEKTIGIKEIGARAFTEKDIVAAREVFMMGTTLDVLPVTEFEGRRIGDGKVGSVAKALLREVRLDQGFAQT